MPNKCIKTIFYIADAGAGGNNDRFFAETGDLTTYGTYLNDSKEKLVGLLNDLKAKLSDITTGWADKDGLEFKGKFEKFIAEADKINTELGTLSTFASGQSSRYETILAESLEIMSKGG